MDGKIPSEILEIRLNNTTFKETNTVIEPTFINFFFGRNGTGKSTIAQTIQNITPDKNHIILVYN